MGREAISELVVIVEVLDRHLDDPVGVDGVRFANEGPLLAEPLDMDAAELDPFSVEARVEREIDVGKAGEVAARMPLVVDVAAFDVAEVSNVVGGAVGALGDRARRAFGRERHVVVEDGIERNLLAAPSFAKNTEYT